MDQGSEFETATTDVVNAAVHHWRVAPALAAIYFAILLGIIATVASVYTAQTTTQASKADVERSRQLIEQVKVLQKANADNADAKFTRLCQQINEIAAELNVHQVECAVAQ